MPFASSTIARSLAASSLTVLLLVGCSGTKVPDGPASTADGGGASNGGGGGGGNGGNPHGGGNGDSDGGRGAGGACPCALESYCDLSTNTCKAGCTDNAQCNPGRTCDLANRVCKDTCSGAACAAQSCPAPAPAAGQTCNGITPDGAAIAVACKTGTAPTPKGGAITGGAYVLTAVELYQTGCTPSTARGQVYVCGSTWSFAFDQGLGGIKAATTTATTASATSYSLTQTCPAAAGGAPEIIGFDATATTLTLYGGSPDALEVDHYTLR